MTPPRAANRCIADKGDDGNAHPERIERSGVPVVREGIESDVDAVVECEVTRTRDTTDKFDAMGFDTAAMKDVEHVVMDGARGEKQKAGIGDFPERGGPEAKDAVVHFAKVIETAESDVAVASRRKSVDRRIVG